MEREEESKKSEEKDNIEEVEEEDKKEKQKSRKKSEPKNKKNAQTNRNSRKKKSEDIESGNSEEEQEKIEEEEVKEEVKGDEERRGVKYYKDAIDTYLKKFKNKTMQKFWTDTIFKGVNYKYVKPAPLNGWGKKQNFLFVRCGDMIRTEKLAKDDYEKIENMPALVYYTITLYKNENKVKKGKPLLITILHLYFKIQVRLSTKLLNDWVLLEEVKYNKIEDVVTGNFANKQIYEIYIKIKNENELPKNDSKTGNLDKEGFIAYLNDKIKLNNIDNPLIKEI